MASIADVYVTILPETGRIAKEIEKALRGVDARKIGQEIGRELQQGIGDTKVDLKVDSAKAKAAIEAAAKDQKVHLEAEADTAVAEAELDHAARDRTVEMDVDVDKSRVAQTGAEVGAEFGKAMIKANASAMTGLTDIVSGALQSVGRQGVVGVAAIAAMGPPLAALASAAAAAAGALALIPAALAAIGAGAGVMMIGLSGITEAYEAVSGAAKDAGKDAEAHASKVQSANRSVSSAQRSLTAAVKSEESAQKDVARARRDALHELQDINDELRNGAIDETQAQLDLAKAREELATGTFDSSIDYQQAQLNVIKAEQRLKEAHEDNVELDQESIDKRAKGVDQADEVVAAEERLATAQQNTAAAQTALADAQTKLIDAQKETSTSAQKAAEAMGLLSPAGQEFINSLMALTPVWNQFKQDLQQPLLAGMGETLTNTVNALLPAITPGLQRIAGAFNAMFQGVGEWLQKPENLATMQTIVNNIATAFEKLAPAMQPLMSIFGDLMEVGSGFLPGLADAFTTAATAFAEFIGNAKDSGKLQEFIAIGLDTFRELAPLIPTIADAFERFMKAGVMAMPGLVLALQGLITAASYIVPLLIIPFQLLEWTVKAVNGAIEIGKIVWDGFVAIVMKVHDWIIKLANAVWDYLGEKFRAVKEIIAVFWDDLKARFPIIQQFEDLWKNAWAKIKGFFDGARTWLPAIIDWIKDKISGMIPDWIKKLAPNIFGSTTSGNAVPAPNAPPGSPGPPSNDSFYDQWYPSSGPNPPAPAPSGAVPVIPGPNGTWTSSNPEWAKLIQRESAGSPTVPQGDIGDVNNATGDLAMGLFQITGETWRANGGLEFAPSADQATPQEQGIVAGRIFAARGGQPWGATPGGGREDEAALRAGLAPGSTPSVPSPATPSTPGVPAPAPSTPGAVPTTAAATPGEQVGTTAVRERINAALGMNVVTGYRAPDGFDEHSGGNAVDVAVSSTAQGEQVMAEAFRDPNVDYVIWQQRMRYPDGRVGPLMDDRGSPTANHFDHVHVHTKSTGYAPGNEPEVTGKARGSNAAAYPGTPSPPSTPTDSHVIPLNPNIPPGQQAKAKDSAKGMGEQLGKDIVSGMLEIFGFGDLFKDPTEFGIFKIFKSLMGIKPGSNTTSTGGPANAGSTNAGSGSGTGNPLIDFAAQFIPGGQGGSIVDDIAAWQGGNNTNNLSMTNPSQFQGPGPGNNVDSHDMNVTVQGNVDKPALNTMNTEHLTHMRNTGGH